MSHEAGAVVGLIPMSVPRSVSLGARDEGRVLNVEGVQHDVVRCRSGGVFGVDPMDQEGNREPSRQPASKCPGCWYARHNLHHSLILRSADDTKAGASVGRDSEAITGLDVG